MEIKRLEREAYAGKPFTARYQTGGYYDICPSEDGFRLRYVPLAAPEERSFDDVFLSEWLEEPVAFGAFENGTLLGFVEGSLETWNNRFCISNLCVFEESSRRRGVGTALMDTITKAAAASGARMLVLETQSCNERAIAFYRRNGFAIIGFDLYAYSNTDPERHAVRLTMGKALERAAVSG